MTDSPHTNPEPVVSDDKTSKIQLNFGVILTSIVVSLLVAGLSTWGVVQRIDERVSSLEEARVSRAAADTDRDAKIDSLQRLLIRVDERTAGTDRRVQRMEASIDRIRNE